MSALGNEKIDIIEWSDNPNVFVENALSPAKVMRVDLDKETGEAQAYVMPDQQSLAIGKGGQNARLAAKLTGWTIDIRSIGGDDEDESEIAVDPDGEDVEVEDEKVNDENDSDTTPSEPAEESSDSNEETAGTEEE
jgi:N utilization substance protein A